MLVRKFIFGLFLFFVPNLESCDFFDVISYTLETNPAVESRKSDYTSATHLEKRAISGFFPQAKIESGYGRERAFNRSIKGILGGRALLWRKHINLNVSQYLYDFGRQQASLDQRRHETAFGSFRFYEKEEEIAFAAVEAYFNVLRNREIVEIYRAQVVDHEETYDKIQRKVEAKAGKASESYLARSRLALAQSRLREADSELIKVENDFIKVTGLCPNEEMMLPSSMPEVPGNVCEATEIAMRINPSLSAAYANVSASRSQLDYSKAELWPDVKLDFNVNNSNNLNGVPGGSIAVNGLIKLNWDVFTSGGNEAKMRSDLNLHRKTIYDLRDAERIIIDNVTTSYEVYDIFLDRLQFLTEYKDEAYNVNESYIKEFQLGGRTLFDLLNSKIEYYQAWVGEVNGNYEVYIGKYRIMAAMGKLVDTLNSLYAVECCE